MSQFFLDVYVIAVGFTVAGLCTSGSQLLTGRPMRFGLPEPQGRFVVCSVLVRALAGPQIIMRNAIMAAARGINKPYWVAATTVIASLWSFISGACVLLLIDGLAAWLS